MIARIACAEEACTECERIVGRVYSELRRAGYGERPAFQSAMHVLALRHPGHEREYYQRRARAIIAPEHAA